MVHIQWKLAKLKQGVRQVNGIIIPFLMLFVSATMGAQNDTLYYNADWKTTVKDSASFFRPPVKKEGDVFRVEDFYSSGRLQMSGTSSFADRDVWEGKVTWYNEDGSILQEGRYKNNRLDGEYISTLGGKKLTAQFENGRMVSGKTNGKFNSSRQFYSEMRGDTIVNIIYDKDINGVRYERYSVGKQYDVLIKYFDTDGKLLGKREALPDYKFSGIEVSYYQKLMRPMEIKYYPNGTELGSTFFYCKDQVREEFSSENGLSKTYYSPNGEVMGKINYKYDNTYLKPVEGREYTFYNSYDQYKAELIKGIREYSAGKLLKEELFYENQKLRTATTYNEGAKEQQVSYNEQGEEIARMVYDNWAPLNGTEIIGNKEITYANGTLVEEIEYYFNTQIVFSKKTPTKQVFYDKDGSVLGTLNFEDDNGYSKLIQGDRFTIDFDGDISAIESYDNGYVTKRISYRKRQVGEKEKEKESYKKIEFFEANGYKRIKEITHYSNGNKQSEVVFDNYTETTGIFYDEQGKVIGEYNYQTKEGTLYEFFGDSDKLKLMELRKDGEQVKLKRYDYGPDAPYGQIIPVLVEDIDANCCASFYSREGELLGKVDFKEGKPWEGTYYDVKLRTSYTLKEGTRNGAYIKYDYDRSILEEGNFQDNKEEGPFTYYGYNGQLVKIENYSSGKLHGIAKYYDKDKVVIGEITYENGLPMNGTRITNHFSSKNPIIESYVSGKLVKRISHDDNGKRISTYIDGKETETTAYYGDTDKKRLTYSVKDRNLDGTVIRYDIDGKEQQRGLFEGGKFIEGTVMLTGGNVRGNPEYIIMTKEQDVLGVKLMGQHDKVLFSAEEKLAFGTATVFMQSLDIYMDYLGPDRLY